MIKNSLLISRFVLILKQQFNEDFFKHIRLVKDININHRNYYFFNDMINLNDFDSSLLKIDKKSYEYIDIYYIGYIAIKKIDDHENITSVNPMHLIIHSSTAHFKEKNDGKY